MKKIYAFAAFAAALTMFSCNKEKVAEVKDDVVTINVSYEEPETDSDTKISISESGTKFTLLFDGGETMKIGNTTNTTVTEFSTTDSGSRSANFTGTLPTVGGSTTNYIGVLSTFGSVSGTGIRGSIAANQVYNDASVAKNGLLVGREDDCSVGTLPKMSLKTMNAFLKFSLVKGSAAPGSSNDYSSHMYVTKIIVESVNEEQLSGKFGIAKTGSDWADGYIEDAGITAGEKSTKVTLDCTDGGSTAGVDLTASATDFFIAIAFGTYAKGLKVTINVQNAADGDTGKLVAYISKNTSYTINRNTMVAMPSLTVNPEDSAEVICWSETWDNGTANDSASAYLSGSADGFYKLSGTITYAQSKATNVYVINDNLAGGAKPELMIKSGATWTVSGIPTAGATTLSLDYLNNNGKASATLVSATNATITGSGSSYTITTGGDATVNIKFSASGNTRVDNVVVKVAE